MKSWRLQDRAISFLETPQSEQSVKRDSGGTHEVKMIRIWKETIMDETWTRVTYKVNGRVERNDERHELTESKRRVDRSTKWWGWTRWKVAGLIETGLSRTNFVEPYIWQIYVLIKIPSVELTSMIIVMMGTAQRRRDSWHDEQNFDFDEDIVKILTDISRVYFHPSCKEGGNFVDTFQEIWMSDCPEYGWLKMSLHDTRNTVVNWKEMYACQSPDEALFLSCTCKSFLVLERI